MNGYFLGTEVTIVHFYSKELKNNYCASGDLDHDP